MRLVLTLGPSGKGVRYQDGYKSRWDWLMDAHPDLPDIFDDATIIHTRPDTPPTCCCIIPGGA
jgi:hypothetical protein